jgi:flavin reductase (DIM6/NTAB) family NADH-FMN oxidoreductase RutF
MSVASPAATEVAEHAFRRVLGRFATGVTLVTAPGGESLVVNAFMSVSLRPPLVAFAVGQTSLTWRRMRRSPILGINVLSRAVEDVRARAVPGADRLGGLDVRLARDGVPQVAEAVAFLLCETVEERPAGDHGVVVARVVEAELDEDVRPLVFFGGDFGSFAA